MKKIRILEKIIRTGTANGLDRGWTQVGIRQDPDEGLAMKIVDETLREVGSDLEQEYLHKAREGDMRAFTALVKRYEERALKLAYAIVGNWEDARECAQDAFVKAFYGLKKFQGQSHFYTWLCRILINRCKDFLRKKKNRFHLFSFGSGAQEEGQPDFLESQAGSGLATLKPILNKELETEIERAVRQLPFRQQSAFTLRYFEGLDLKAIAYTLEISEGAVKAHLWKAVMKMRSLLAGYLDASGD